MHITRSQKRQSDQLTDQTLMHEAASLLLACLASCDRNKIDPKKYWDHAQKALVIGAQRGDTIQRMVSEMHGQLPIEGAFYEKSASKIYSICETIAARKDYRRFREVCRKQAPYIVVLARIEREEREKNEGWI